MRLTGCVLAVNQHIYRKGVDTGFRVLQGRRVLGPDGCDTGYRIVRLHFCDTEENQTGFYIGGCAAVNGYGAIYGPNEQMPWEKEGV